MNTFFNFDDYTNPIKTYIDGRFTFDLLPGYVKRNDVFIQSVLYNKFNRKNGAEVQDSYFAYQPGGTQKEFVGIDRVDQRMAVANDYVLFGKNIEVKRNSNAICEGCGI